jgi:putative PIN family toxin of toxin-antitoxin system
MAVPVRLVLDTNVWLDWLVFDDAQVAPLRAAQGAGEAAIFIDAACTEELRRVLDYSLRKEVLAPEAQARALAECLRVAQSVAAGEANERPLPPLPLCRDKDDQKFLELARAARADYLLTKDRALLDLARRKYQNTGFRIMTPAAYLQQREAQV